MDKLKSLQTDLETARKDFRTLQDELPQFHALLTDNEQDAAKLRRERASLDDQAPAKNRVMVAREMLEQHQSDITTARAEVTRLEGLERRELSLLTMVDQAKTAKTHREAMDKAVEDVTRALHKASETFLREWHAEREARQQFAETGWGLVPHFRDMGVLYDPGMPKRIALETLTAELAERGAPLHDVTDSATGRYTTLDTTRRDLPRDRLSMVVWDAVRLLGGHEAGHLTRALPNRPVDVIMPSYLSPPDPYSI